MGLIWFTLLPLSFRLLVWLFLVLALGGTELRYDFFVVQGGMDMGGG